MLRGVVIAVSFLGLNNNAQGCGIGLQDIKRILIVDLEATCWNDRPQTVEVMEVIEFGCALASFDGTLYGSCSQLVKPALSPDLSPYCVELTGITQEMVNGAPSFSAAVKRLDDKLQGWAFDAWGSWGLFDFNQLKVEGARHGVLPGFTQLPHINIKAVWQSTQGRRKKAGLKKALTSLGMDFHGAHHRGEEDAKNIVRVLPYLEVDKLESATISKL